MKTCRKKCKKIRQKNSSSRVLALQQIHIFSLSNTWFGQVLLLITGDLHILQTNLYVPNT